MTGAQAGIWDLESCLIEPVLSQRLSLAFGVGLSNIQSVGAQSVAFASRALAPSNGVTATALPFRSSEGSVLTWDGRLDNREYLRSQLRDELGGEQTDEEIIYAAYAKWGMDALERFIGDWALALWDHGTRTLILARDYAGVRPLYYLYSGNLIIWASDLDTLVRLAGSTPDIDDGYLRAFIVSNPPSTATPYRGIVAVPAGKILSFRGRRRIERWAWRLRPNEIIRYHNDADYAEHFHSLFRQSVRDRMYAQTQVWAELSGGFDSSSIVCLADEIIRGRDTPAVTVVPISYVPSDTTPDDERKYAALVRKKTRRPSGVEITEGTYSLLLPILGGAPLGRPVAGTGRVLDLVRLMGLNSVTTLLSGIGGDGVMWSSPRMLPHLSDLAASGKVAALHRALVEDSLATGRTYWDLLWHEAIRTTIAGKSAVHLPRLPEWLRFTGDDLNCEDAETPLDTVSLRSITNVQRVSYLQVVESLKIPSFHHFRSCGPIQPAYPFLDRRLIQFMLALPFNQKRSGGLTRVLHRRALSGILPEEITRRVSKVGAQGSLSRAVDREWRTLCDVFGKGAQVVQRGYIDMGQFWVALQRTRHGQDSDVLELMRTIAVELWLRESTPKPQPFTLPQSPSPC
jgi:asparagine synthase (glutamine-hydrolysing)